MIWNQETKTFIMVHIVFVVVSPLSHPFDKSVGAPPVFPSQFRTIRITLIIIYASLSLTTYTSMITTLRTPLLLILLWPQLTLRIHSARYYCDHLSDFTRASLFYIEIPLYDCFNILSNVILVDCIGANVLIVWVSDRRKNKFWKPTLIYMWNAFLLA